MDKKPVVVVGSSSEAEQRGLIAGIRANLPGATVRNWKTLAWPLTRSTLEGVVDMVGGADFAVFILSADDVATIRGKQVSVARDNVIFELGVSIGKLGVDRTFIMCPDGDVAANHHRPSDLLGITVTTFESEGDVQDATARACDQMWPVIVTRGRRDRSSANGDITRGETTRLEVIADGAFYVQESRDRYAADLRDAIMEGARLPQKFQFAQPDGGHHWLRLCKSVSYHYYARAKALLRDNRQEIAGKVAEVLGTTAVDLISLGCGDGTKDELLLRALIDELPAHEYVYYYPIDISDSLLVETVRHIANHGVRRDRLRCKPVLGDFTDLKALAEIINYRSNPNLFSLLGNALGSFDEEEIVGSIGGAMRPGDLVLIEANVGVPDDSSPLLKEDAAHQWDLSTLKALDISVDACKIEQEIRKDVSAVPGAQTLLSYAVPLDCDGRNEPRYTLSAMHHYQLKPLIAHVMRELKLDWVEPITDNGVALLLGRRGQGG
jgi:Histidine-specific methyltransferase, SAM-dependent/Predicted nucleotide-binding protein containing TIR-like domain